MFVKRQETDALQEVPRLGRVAETKVGVRCGAFIRILEISNIIRNQPLTSQIVEAMDAVNALVKYANAEFGVKPINSYTIPDRTPENPKSQVVVIHGKPNPLAFWFSRTHITASRRTLPHFVEKHIVPSIRAYHDLTNKGESKYIPDYSVALRKQMKLIIQWDIGRTQGKQIANIYADW